MRICWLMVTICGMVLGSSAAGWAGALEEYLERDAGVYSARVVESERLGQADRYVVELISQEWRGKLWRHWLTIVVPNGVRHSDAAILVIGGGSNAADAPRSNSSEARVAHLAAQQLGVTVAILEQVPNQPLFDGLYEDALIAKTFDKFMNGGDADWPLLLPMTKSAVRAMDAVAEVVTEQRDLSVERFIVGGASKRGWTTYLTAATDGRVVGIVPMVIDVLNFSPQMIRQNKTYGTPSDMIGDYTERGLTAVFDTQRGQELVRIVDPYAYREAMTMPKLVMLGTNDPYWTVDAANLYFSDLPQPRLLHYGANVGHTVGLGSIPTLLGFFERVLDERSVPELAWQPQDNGDLLVTWEGDANGIRLYRAWSADRDFRQADWESERINVADGDAQVRISLDEPDEGWAAYFVEVEFADGNPHGHPVRLSTKMTVLPRQFPYEAD